MSQSNLWFSGLALPSTHEEFMATMAADRVGASQSRASQKRARGGAAGVQKAALRRL
jgi:hypothetical protein